MRSTLRPLLAGCSAAARRDVADSCAIAGRMPQRKYPRTPNNNSLPFNLRMKPPQDRPYLSLPETILKTTHQLMAHSLALFQSSSPFSAVTPVGAQAGPPVRSSPSSCSGRFLKRAPLLDSGLSLNRCACSQDVRTDGTVRRVPQ